MSQSSNILGPPFVRSFANSAISCPRKLISDVPTTSGATSLCYAQCTTMRRGGSLVRVKDDLDAYYATELMTTRLDAIKSYLWLAGVPTCGRPLHRQLLLGRDIIITEDPNEHLVWHETKIFVKPLPIFLLDLDCWTRKFCKNKDLYKPACGFLFSYAWLVRYESDLRIAHEKGLLPDSIDWPSWRDFIDEFLEHIDLQSLSMISPRYHYGELRLSRLNKIHYTTRFTWDSFFQGYITTSTWYQDYFSRNFAWLLAIFAAMSVALSAMQVSLAVEKGGAEFENASYGFSIACLFLVAGAALILLIVWAILFVYHVVNAWMKNRLVMQERKRGAGSGGRPKC